MENWRLEKKEIYVGFRIQQAEEILAPESLILILGAMSLTDGRRRTTVCPYVCLPVFSWAHWPTVPAWLILVEFFEFKVNNSPSLSSFSPIMDSCSVDNVIGWFVFPFVSDRSEFLVKLKTALTSLINSQLMITELKEQQESLIASARTRLKWAAGSNPTINDVRLFLLYAYFVFPFSGYHVQASVSRSWIRSKSASN